MAAADNLLLFAEAEAMADSLIKMDVGAVGSAPWLAQRQRIEALALQAHQSARLQGASGGVGVGGGGGEEFVKELLISCDKVETVVHELLVIEAWRDTLLPPLLAHDAQVLERNAASMNLQLVCGHEVTITGLLEVALYHRDTWDCLADDELLLELVDYCYRKLVYLNSELAAKDTVNVAAETSRERMLAMTAMEEHENKMGEWRFKAAMAALSILRYLTQYMSELHPCVMARMLDANDTIAALVALADKRPWLRRRRRSNDKAVVVEAYEDGVWRELAAGDRLRVTKPDAQMWLSLYNTILQPMARNKYQYDDHRRETVSRLRKHFSQAFLDQLPILVQLQRAVEEIALMSTPATGEVKQGRLVMQQVPTIREQILDCAARNKAKIVADLCATVFGDSEEARSSNKSYMDSVLRNIDFLINLEPEVATGKPAPKDAPGAGNGVAKNTKSDGGGDENGSTERWQVSVDAMRLSKNRIWQMCMQGLEFQTAHSAKKPPEPVELKNAQGWKIKGFRHRLTSAKIKLQPFSESLIPFDGKLCVRVTTSGGKTLQAEEALSLPTVHQEAFNASSGGSSSTAEEPIESSLFDNCVETTWVTVGLLATDGFALQLKLARTKSVNELQKIIAAKDEDQYRDPQSKQMYIYRIIGGLLTVRSDSH